MMSVIALISSTLRMSLTTRSPRMIIPLSRYAARSPFSCLSESCFVSLIASGPTALHKEGFPMTNLPSWKNACAVLLFGALATIASPAQTLTTLVEFTGTQGQAPSALIQGFDGDFYGTTQLGGANNSGSAFKLTSSGTMTTLYSFCSQFGQGFCSDGKAPTDGLVQATNGTFYGTTATGGMDDMGSIFTIDPSGKFTSLYSFCAQM